MKVSLKAVSACHPAAAPGSKPAIEGIDLEVAPGEQVALIGPSGAGKTTLLQVLCATLQPQAGEVHLGASNPWALRKSKLQKLRGQLIVAPQVPPLPPRQRVVTSVLAGRLPGMGFLASLKSLLYPSDIPAAHEALGQFDLAEKLFERVDRLSGGERQRVGLARLMVSPAKLWMVDEPLSALDPTRAKQAISTLTGQARQRGITLIATLHQVDAALGHFPRIVGLRDGKVAFDLPSGQVTNEMLKTLYAQYEYELLGARPPMREVASNQDQTQAAPRVMHCR